MTQGPRSIREGVGDALPSQQAHRLPSCLPAVFPIGADPRPIIGGDGSEHDALVERGSVAGLGDRLQLPDRMAAGEVAAAMSGAACVVVPSRSEAFGIAALEAWRSGTALVMTTRRGGAEFVRDGTDGVFVDPEDTPELAATFQRVLRDAEFRSRRAGAGALKVRPYSWGRTVNAHRRLYRSVFAGTDRPA
jgi:glycosyltransferase involved in cell wall biosynthesis